jgi:sugar lactone lactonase YvrE
VTAAPPAAWNRPDPRLVWPAPPEPARIQYLGAIHSPADIGLRPGFVRRLVDFVFGKEETALVKPVSLARNRTGLLVVADPAVPTVHFFDLEARRHHRLSGTDAEMLSSPVGVAVDDEGRTYVADSVRRRVFVFDAERELVDEFGVDLLQRPTGVALAPEQDRLYVVDTLACQVVAFDRAGREVARLGRRGVGPGEFNFPTYIAVGSDGAMRISDSLNFRVQVLRPDGAPLGRFGQAGDAPGDFARPKGLATDRAGRIYVVDAGFENVQIFGPDGALLLVFGGPGTLPGEFYLPSGIFLDASDTLWVADSFNGRVQVFQLVGEPQ